MEYNVQLAYLAQGDIVEGFYILKTAAVRQSSNGKPYLSATLADSSGVMDGKMWDYAGTTGPEDEGKIIKIRGEVQEYKGSLQMTIRRMRFAQENDAYDLADLVPVAPIDSVKEMEYIQELISGIEDEDYRAICGRMLDRHIASFGTLPAAKAVHHSFLSGLLMHTGSMLRIADFLAREIYPETVNRSLLLAGTLLHDIGKEREFAVNNLGIVTDYTAAGYLLGHLVMGAEEAGEVGRDLGVPEEKIMLLQHMLLSHHGTPEFGAAVRPATAEAELLSYIDLMDSRMEIYAETLESVEPGKFSDKVFAMDGKRLYKENVYSEDAQQLQT